MVVLINIGNNFFLNYIKFLFLPSLFKINLEIILKIVFFILTCFVEAVAVVVGGDVEDGCCKDSSSM